MNPYLIVIPGVLIGHYLLELLSDWLNLRHVSTDLPADFEGYYDADRYGKSQEYLRETTRFSIVADTIQIVFTLVFILIGGFNLVDRMAMRPGMGSIGTGLAFAGILIFATRMLNLPFNIYSTFVIEQKYGFNRTTPATFVTDILKSLLLTALIGGVVFAAILWFFEKTGDFAWVYCWIATVVFQVLIIFIAPYVILPLFNKFTALEDGELRTSIERYASSRKFRMKGVFKMDGAKRSAKTNAFFTGIGRSRRIVLFDTLIAKHTVAELVAVVAHEMGHYKKKHILQAMARSVVSSGVMFFLLSLFMENQLLFDAFKMERVSIHGSLFFFGLLYTPIAVLISIVEHAISRRHEYDADTYAVETTGSSEPMVSGLKKLTVDNLGNLTPHPFKVFLSYGHPPVLARIRAIQARSAVGLALPFTHK